MSCGRRGLASPFHERCEFAPRLLDRHTDLEPPHHGEIVTAASSRAGWSDLDRCPDFGCLRVTRRETKILGHHPNDGTPASVEKDFTANDSAVAAEGALPESEGDVCRQRCARFVIRGCNEAAMKGRHAKQV